MQDDAGLCEEFSTPRRPSAKGGGFKRSAHSAGPCCGLAVACSIRVFVELMFATALMCTSMHIHRKGLFKRSLPCSYHHNFDKRQTIPNISNFESKKRPGGRPGAPKTMSKLRENWSRALFRHVKSYNFGKPVICAKRCRGFRPNFGVPLRSKNRPGTRPWQKIGSPENDFNRFLCFYGFSRFFGSILARFLRKKQ